MELTHLGHACLLIEHLGTRMLFDPGVLSDFDHVRDLDAILVTHQHADHLDVERLAPLVSANPRAGVFVDVDTAEAVDGLPAATTVARPGDTIRVGSTTVEVMGGVHAAVYADVPGCTNAAYLVDGGRFFHPGDSLLVPERPIDVLAVAIDGPWLKLSEAVDYVRAVNPRVAVPIHEGETTDAGKYAGMLAAFAPSGVVTPLVAGEAVTF